MKVDFNRDVLGQLLDQQADKAMGLAEKFPKINDWTASRANPTMNQLAQLAKYFQVPFGYFFLRSAPQRIYPIPHYRTNIRGSFHPSGELLETIKTLEKRQEWAKDLRADVEHPLSFANTLSVKSHISEAADLIRELLKVNPKWSNQELIHNWTDAFRFLISRAEEAGIFVVVNGVVNNNTKRILDVNEFRGFVLYDRFAPFIFINNNDFVSGKIFTIIHEIAHILIGESASFDYQKLIPAHAEIEEFCDAVAAEFLVPEKLLEQKVTEIGRDYEALSRLFRVSQLVIARRLLDTEVISKPQFFAAYNSFKRFTTETPARASEGGNFYNTAPYRISKSFFNLIYANVKQNKLLYRDAFRLTGLSPKSFDGYVKEHYLQT
jgi:Zn-dependent peptidase ImmA (M78 family)